MSQRRDSCESEGGYGGGAAGEVGRQVDSNQADDRRMIRYVRARRLLYARNNMPVASYYTQVKALWQEVADEMGWTVADVRRKWSHIRNSFSRHLRNEMLGARTGKGRVVSRWYLADELEFLREHMATDTRTTPYSTTYAPTFLEMDLSEQASNPEPPDVKPFINNPWFALSTQAAKNYEQRIEPSEDSNVSTAQGFAPDENCSYFQFFRGIYNDYQELSARKQRQFKRQCMGFLHDLLDEDEQTSSNPAAINLTNCSSASEDEKDHKAYVVKTEGISILPTS